METREPQGKVVTYIAIAALAIAAIACGKITPAPDNQPAVAPVAATVPATAEVTPAPTLCELLNTNLRGSFTEIKGNALNIFETVTDDGKVFCWSTFTGKLVGEDVMYQYGAYTEGGLVLKFKIKDELVFNNSDKSDTVITYAIINKQKVPFLKSTIIGVPLTEEQYNTQATEGMLMLKVNQISSPLEPNVVLKTFKQKNPTLQRA